MAMSGYVAAVSPEKYGERYWLIAQYLCLFAASIALANLILGWSGGIEFFVRIREEYPAMVVETALCILLGAIGTLCLYRMGAPEVWGFVAQVMGLLVLGIVVVASIRPIRLAAFHSGDTMSIATSATCMIVGLGLILPSLSGKPLSSLRMVLLTLGLALVSVALIGYAFDAPALFSHRVFSAMALHTALGLLFVLFGLLMTTPHSGWLGVLLARGYGSDVARGILPVIVIGPLLLCGAALIATNEGFLNPELRLAVLAVAMIAMLLCATFCFAHLVNESERRTAEATRRMNEAERQRQAAEMRLTRQQKAEALGQLVGGVAHDFNNTLTVINGNLELLAEASEPAVRQSYVDDALAAVIHAAQLTRQLLAYGRKSRLAPREAVVQSQIEPALTMFRRLNSEQIEVDTRLLADNAVSHLDSGKFQQALLNLLINSRDAMPTGGRIVVESKIEEIAEPRFHGFADGDVLRPGIYVRVSVVDNGIGMEEEVLARATEPYFTTKPDGEGSGLGLSVVAGFCRQSGGVLRLQSAQSGGLDVSMYFPFERLAQPGEVLDAPEEAANLLPATGTRILIVEDDPPVARVLRNRLAADGHQVQVARNGEEALVLLARSQTLPEVMLADMVMPGSVPGHVLVRRVIEQYSSIRVVVMSGYGSERQRQQMPWAASLPMIQKPVDRNTLRRVVAEALAGRPQTADM